MFDEKEERKKQARSNKQGKAHVHVVIECNKNTLFLKSLIIIINY